MLIDVQSVSTYTVSLFLTVSFDFKYMYVYYIIIKLYIVYSPGQNSTSWA